MFEKTVTVTFFAATFGAVALAAVLGAKAMNAGTDAQIAASTPIVKFETVVISGQRTKVSSNTYQTPEQAVIVR